MKISKSKLRFIRCLWHDKVDLLIWLVTVGMFVGFFFFRKDTNGFLFLLIFYIYYALYRIFTFWQDREKMYRYIESLGKNPFDILYEEDI